MGNGLFRFDPRRAWHTLQMVQPLQHQVAREHKEILRELRETRRVVARHHAHLERTLASHAALLARIPELQTQVDRCVAIYQQDLRSADRVASFHATVDPDAVRAHARRAVRCARLQWDPYPHVVVNDVLPDDVYDRAVEAMPPPIFFERVAEHRDELAVPFTFAPAYSRLVWGLFQTVVECAVLSAVVETCRPALDEFIRASWPELGTWGQSAITLRVANARLLLRRPGYVIKPHRDPRWGFMTALFYMSPRGTTHAYGTQLYRMKVERDEPHTSPFWARDGECELVRDVPGVANSALVFLNGTGAHGASIPADAPADLLRYVYQARFSPDAQTKARLIDLLGTEARDRWIVTR